MGDLPEGPFMPKLDWLWAQNGAKCYLVYFLISIPTQCPFLMPSLKKIPIGEVGFIESPSKNEVFSVSPKN